MNDISSNLCFNPLTPVAFHQNAVLDVLENFSLEMRHISSDLVEKATYQHAFLPNSTTFYGNFARACPEIYVLRLLVFLSFLSLSFFSFSYLFAAVIDLLLDLIPIQKILRKHHRDGHILPCMEKQRKDAGNFPLSFRSNF